MNIEIVTTPLRLDIYGFSGTALNKDYAGMAFQLSGRMWQVVKEAGIKNKGQNIWVYENGERVFAGVELLDLPQNGSELQHKSITLQKYAYFKHVGPYQLIAQAGKSMNEAIQRKGYHTTLPYIEIYGHWNNDHTKLETELFMSLV